jgi:MoaA/NifB/PqqE/SkfB family radical SAM enzyme
MAKSKALKIPVAYWTRYLKFLVKYGTVRKHWNFGRSLLNWLLGRTRIGTLPSFLKVEITRQCKVACKYCFVEKFEWQYSFENYKALVDRLRDHVYLVSLYDIGEPLESPDLINCIRYAKKNGIGSVISTSLSVEKKDEFWPELVHSGLDKIIVAIDGITPAVYNKYRTGGRLDLVFDNLNRILDCRGKHRSSLFIEWQMVAFPWNAREQKEAEAMAYQLGCDNFRIIKDVSKRLTYKKQNFVRKKNCLLPYIIFIVTANNKVRPCYKIYDAPVEIGDLNQNSFEEIWNGSEVFRIRDKRQIGCRVGCQTCQE